MRISVIQMALADGESPAERTERAAALVRGQAGTDLVVLPELWHVGAFDFRRWDEAGEPVDGPVGRAMADAARDAGVVLHAGSIIERVPEPGPDGRHLYNTALVYDRDGSLVTTYRKMHRFCRGKEPELLEAGTDLAALAVGSATGESLRAGLATCYDIRFPEQFGALLTADVQMYLVPASWPMARLHHWRTLLQARAIENQAYVVAANAAGTHARQLMAGHSMVIGPEGQILAEAGEGQQVLTVEIEAAAVDELRASFPVLADRDL